jgi:hypothetical protein
MQGTSDSVANVAVAIATAVDATLQESPKLFGDEALMMLDEIRELILADGYIVPSEERALALDRKVLELRARIECCRAIEQLAHSLIAGA